LRFQASASMRRRNERSLERPCIRHLTTYRASPAFVVNRSIDAMDAPGGWGPSVVVCRLGTSEKLCILVTWLAAPRCALHPLPLGTSPSKRNTESRNGSRRHRMAARLVTRRGVRPSVAAHLRAVTAPPCYVAVQGPDRRGNRRLNRCALEAQYVSPARAALAGPVLLGDNPERSAGASVGREGATGDRSPSGAGGDGDHAALPPIVIYGRSKCRTRCHRAACHAAQRTTQGSDRPQSVKHLKVTQHRSLQDYRASTALPPSTAHCPPQTWQNRSPAGSELLSTCLGSGWLHAAHLLPSQDPSSERRRSWSFCPISEGDIESGSI
jgi:hypothetical protein